MKESGSTAWFSSAQYIWGSFTPTKKVGGKCFSHAEGEAGHRQSSGSSNVEHLSFSHLGGRGGGAQQVLNHKFTIC